MLSCAVAHAIPCATIDWEYQTGYASIGFFRVYVSTVSGTYRFCGPDPTCLPSAVWPAFPELITEMSCANVLLWAPGTYYMVLTAVSLDMQEESAPSNEVSFEIPGALTPAPPVPPSPSPLPPPTYPPFPTWPPPVVLAPLPSGSSGGNLSESCVWKGGPC